MASCLFEVITLGLFPSASWEEVASLLVQMLLVRTVLRGATACNRGDSSKLEIEQWPHPSLDPISWRTMLCSWHFSTTHKRQSRASIAIHCARCDILVPSALKCAGEETSPCIASNDLLTAKDLWCGHNHLVANAFSPSHCTTAPSQASVLETVWAAVTRPSHCSTNNLKYCPSLLFFFAGIFQFCCFKKGHSSYCFICYGSRCMEAWQAVGGKLLALGLIASDVVYFI